MVNGRAYFADGPHDRLIITAAHCLPFFLPVRVRLTSVNGPIKNCSGQSEANRLSGPNAYSQIPFQILPFLVPPIIRQ